MNPINEFLLKARANGAEHDIAALRERVRVAEARALKAENEVAELKAALASMQQLKEKYQMVVVDLMTMLERHGLVK